MNAAVLELLGFTARLTIAAAAIGACLAVGLFVLRRHSAQARVRILRFAIVSLLAAVCLSWPSLKESEPLTIDHDIRVMADGSQTEEFSSNALLLPAMPARVAASVLLLGWVTGALLLGWALYRTRELRGQANATGHGYFESDEANIPLAVGLRSPVIIVPTGFTDRGNRDNGDVGESRTSRAGVATHPDTHMILTHEQAHVTNRDPLWLFLAAAARVLLFFHPVSWWLARRLNLEQERAADEHVLSSGAEPRAYAHALLDWAEAQIDRPRLMPVAMASPTQLETRVRWMLQVRTLVRGRKTMVVAVLILMLSWASIGRGVPLLALDGDLGRALGRDSDSALTSNGNDRQVEVELITQ